MSADLHAYRASDDLAEALREFARQDRAFCDEIKAFDDANPAHELLWAGGGGLSADQRPVGFRDGEDDVPEGLSRAKTRVELRPKKSKAGQAWQDVLNRMSLRPKVADVYRRFDVPESAMGGGAPTGGMYVSSTRWADADRDGVIVINGASLDTAAFPRSRSEHGRGPHLTPIPLSEFYAIKERLEGEGDQAVAS